MRPTTAEPEITFIVTYPCPRCHAALEARTSESYTWLRCPKCGRASLPPEHMRLPPPRPAVGEDVLFIGPSPDQPGMSPVAHAPLPPTQGGSVRRIALATGILISLTILVIAFLEQNTANVMIFGVLTIVLFGFLVLSARHR